MIVLITESEVTSKLTSISVIIESPNSRYPKKPTAKYIATHSTSDIRTAELISEGLPSSALMG